ncbi:MAG: DNA-protecting protein DprA, partial [Romboutsia sp.]|nr:DNA-protecting protein DprA [Romboutsia sp.]
GCHKIIKEGAILIHSVEDILNEYKINNNIETSKKYDNINLDEKSIEILQLIKDNGILNIYEICDNTKLEVKYVNTILNELVLKDFLIENNNQVYSLNI